MFRTIAEAEGEGLNPVKMLKAPPRSLTDRSKSVIQVLWGFIFFLFLFVLYTLKRNRNPTPFNGKCCLNIFDRNKEHSSFQEMLKNLKKALFEMIINFKKAISFKDNVSIGLR